MAAGGGRRRIEISVGADKVPVEIDERTTAGDVKRKLGRAGDDWKLLVNNVALSDEEKILPKLTGKDDEIALVPRTDVGSSSIFLTGEKRLKQEETLLRRMGFLPDGYRRYSGLFMAGDRIVKMSVYFPATFPYSRPIITIDDPYFLGKHPCIIRSSYGIEVHFHDSDWKPWMHASELAAQAISFLKSLVKRRVSRCTIDLFLLELLESLRRQRRY
jgi:hypothetical protein